MTENEWLAGTNAVARRRAKTHKRQTERKEKLEKQAEDGEVSPASCG
jgi:hypothetical protein